MNLEQIKDDIMTAMHSNPKVCKIDPLIVLGLIEVAELSDEFTSDDVPLPTMTMARKAQKLIRAINRLGDLVEPRDPANCGENF